MATVVLSIIVLGFLILFHELGHFIAAKIAGVGVLEFSIGFGPSLWSVNANSGTRYGVRAFPLGAFVRLQGEVPGEDEPHGADPEMHFNRKSVFTRMAIVASGPVMNFIVAILVFSSIFAFIGVARFTPVVDEVLQGYPAQVTGLQPGDRIVSVNGAKLSDWARIVEIIRSSAGIPVRIGIQRSGKDLEVEMTPVAEKPDDTTGTIGIIGIRPKVNMERSGAWAALGRGFMQVLLMIVMWIRGIVMMVLGKISPELVGPVGITQMISQASKAGLENLLYLAGAISTVLGMTNLLPIPALDGSKIMFLAVEKIRGKPVDPERESFIHFIGFAILIVLSIVIALKDIQRLSTGGGI